LEFKGKPEDVNIVAKDDPVCVIGFPGPFKPKETTKSMNQQRQKTDFYTRESQNPDDWATIMVEDPQSLEEKKYIQKHPEKTGNFEHDVNTEPGNSGSPVLKKVRGKWTAVGVHIQGIVNGRKYNLATQLTEEFVSSATAKFSPSTESAPQVATSSTGPVLGTDLNVEDDIHLKKKLNLKSNMADAPTGAIGNRIKTGGKLIVEDDMSMTADFSR
jgi:hypothetical protein